MNSLILSNCLKRNVFLVLGDRGVIEVNRAGHLVSVQISINCSVFSNLERMDRTLQFFPQKLHCAVINPFVVGDCMMATIMA